MDHDDTDRETALRERLTDARVPGRRDAAAGLAAAAGDGLSPASVARLAGRVRRDPDPLVRRWAVDALGHAAAADGPVERDGAARPAVDRALDDGDERVRATAVRAVARIDSEPTDRLLGALSDGSALVRRAGVVALGTVGGDVRGHLAKRLDADPDPRVRAEAATVAARVLPADEAAAVLSRHADDPDPLVADRVADAVDRLATDRREPVAGRARDDAEPTARRTAGEPTDPCSDRPEGCSRPGGARGRPAGSRRT